MTQKEFRPKAEEIEGQKLPYPAKQSDMKQQPDSDLSNYKAAEKLKDKVALITGADSGILLRNVYKQPHILCNAPFRACHIPLRIVRRCRHKCGKCLLPYRYRGSLTVPRHSKWRRIPYPVEYSGPSSLCSLPACTKKHNDYRFTPSILKSNMLVNLQNDT
jgi:hypothetical protein